MSFSLIDKRKNDFINGEILWYVHDRTKCELLHVHNSDTENVFVLAVPSFPSNNTGVAHILEHSVLSGSAQYRLKSPFFHYEQGSCRTYLNAATYSDRTLYQGASTLKADFFNLFSMYGDAVLFPLLREEVFHREGFLLLPQEAAAKRKCISSGIVYNEMKGDYSDRNSLLNEAVHRQLFFDMFYRFDSGGNPRDIPELSYEQFLNFHRTWYRPERTKILVYGNIATEEHLAFVESEFLSRWKEAPLPLSEIIPLQTKCNLDKDFYIPVPFAGEDKNSTGTADICWLLGENNDRIDIQKAGFLHSVLVGITGSPLRKKLLESGLADDISILTGLGTQLHELTYTLGLAGFHPDKNSEIKDFILQSLNEVIKEEIPPAFIEATLSRVEFRIREALVNSSGKVAWLSRLARTMIYQQNPLDWAEVNTILATLKKQLAEPRSLERYAEENLLHNFHRICIFSDPVKEYTQMMLQEEDERLQMLWSSYSDKKKEKNRLILKKIDELTNTEDEVEELKSIPRLEVSQLPKKVVVWKEQLLSDSPKMHWVENTRNRLIYLSMHFDLQSVLEDEYLRFLVPTFAAAFTELGTHTQNYDLVATRIQNTTGRMTMNMEHIADLDENLHAFLTIELGVLEQKLDETMELTRALILDLDFSRSSRLKEIVSEGKTMLRNRLPDAGSAYAGFKAASKYIRSAILEDDWNGPSQYHWLTAVGKFERYEAKLEEIKREVFTQERMNVTIVSKEGQRQKIEKAIAELHAQLPSRPYAPLTLSAKLDAKPGKLAFTYPTQVAFNAMVMPAVLYCNKKYAAYELVSKIISNKLLETIRMEQGAYGAGSMLLGTESLLYFYTFRDPNVKASYDFFVRSIEETARGLFREELLSSLIVGTVGERIRVYSPLRRLRMAQFRAMAGIGDGLRQRIRDDLLSLTKQQVVEAATELREQISLSSFATVCDESFLEQMKWDSVELLPQ